MQEDIMRLIELQKIDLEILNIEKSIKEIPQSLQKVRKIKEELLKEIEKLSEVIEEKKKQKNLFEEELKEEYHRLKVTQARLIQIRGSREYQLLLREIEEIKKANKQKEEEILKLMEEIESIEKEKQELENRLKEVEEELKKEEEKFNAYCDELSNNKNKLLMEREKISQKISTRLFKRYEYIKNKKGGIGIAPVVNGICEGCHMVIPPQLYNELQKDNKYYECPHCKRLIFYKKIYINEEQEKETSNNKAIS